MQRPGPGEILLIRHAPADHGGRLCGRRDVDAIIQDGPALNGLREFVSGVAQVVTSPAQRCRQTAETLWPGGAFPQDARLWEQDFGTQEGALFSTLPDLGPLALADLAQHAWPGGESFLQMCARLRPALQGLASRQDLPVAVVAHAGTVRAALGLALGDPARGLAFEVAPLSLTRLRVSGDGFSIVQVNWSALR